MLSNSISDAVCLLVNERAIEQCNEFKSVWSGFGALLRLSFTDSTNTIVIKSIVEPSNVEHPRGWHSQLASERKLQSYRVEQAFYHDIAKHLSVKTPKCFGVLSEGKHQYLILEDLNQQAFKAIDGTNIDAIKSCLTWLAHFHVEMLASAHHKAVWPQGSYWHLTTRQAEFDAIEDAKLKKYAIIFDQCLRSCDYQTLIHGDAKIANFMQTPDKTCAYDFQYTGTGVGIIDVMLLLSSALESDSLFRYEKTLLAHYKAAFLSHAEKCKVESREAIIKQWLSLYPIAWADFVRFLSGWSPTHWKLHDYAFTQLDIAYTLTCSNI